MKARHRKAIIGGGGIFAAALVMGVLVTSKDFEEPDLPSPNGYEDFLTGAYALRGWPEDFYGSESAVLTNREAYASVSVGLNKQCRVPIRMDRSFPTTQEKDLARLKRLTHYLIARAELARMQGRTTEAAQGYCDAYAFATRIGQGGLMLDALVQLSCEALVLRSFQSFAPELEAEQCSKMLRVMQQAEEDSEDWRTVAARQRRWDRAMYSTRERCMGFASRVKRAIETRSWKALDTGAGRLRALETKHRNQTVLSVISILQARTNSMRIGDN